jgi:hypothetical protein
MRRLAVFGYMPVAGVFGALPVKAELAAIAASAFVETKIDIVIFRQYVL